VSGKLEESDILDRLKLCLGRAIERFNSADAATLLCPRKDDDGKDMAQGSSGWGAAGERAIAHRLAGYLEYELSKDGIIQDSHPVRVDCEYNRHLQSQKVHKILAERLSIVEKARRTATPDPDDDDFFVFSIAPDIVVHERGSDTNNLLVIEVKKATNTEIPEYDRLKLECFTNKSSGYGYKLGAAVTAEDNVAPGERRVLPPRWFLNGVAEE
jgi:hypothetical protein